MFFPKLFVILSLKVNLIFNLNCGNLQIVLNLCDEQQNIDSHDCPIDDINLYEPHHELYNFTTPIHMKLAMNENKNENKTRKIDRPEMKDPTLQLKKIVSNYMFGSSQEVTEEKNIIKLYSIEKNPNIFLQSMSGSYRRCRFSASLVPCSLVNDPIKIIVFQVISVGSFEREGNREGRAERFQNKHGVHLPNLEYYTPGHLHLEVTKDFMQTAVDAFFIFTYGNLKDILRLPPDYVLASTRAISMMHLPQEKIVATWTTVKKSRHPSEVTHAELEQYRPLFKYLSGKEIAMLNLSDDKIVNFIGTHPDLNRHQTGIVASTYIKLNPHWSESKYLNIMNNILCGIPMRLMRKIPESTYLQLAHQVFYHTRACDPLQRRFYLVMMTRTQTLGKSYSWNAQDVSRLGLLLAEVEGNNLAAIRPESLSGLTSQVVKEMPGEKLKYFTKFQLRYVPRRALHIIAKKLHKYEENLSYANVSTQNLSAYIVYFLITFISLYVLL